MFDVDSIVSNVLQLVINFFIVCLNILMIKIVFQDFAACMCMMLQGVE